MPIIQGPPLSGFIIPSNFRVIPGNTSFTVAFETNVPCQIELDWWSQNDPSLVTSQAIANEGVPTTQHSFTTGAPPCRPGYTYGWSLRLDANDTTGLQFRSIFQGTAQCTGARAAAGLTVPVRWNQFGDGTRPPGGAGIGNWSSYTWAQYNPKRTTYPTP